MGLNTDGKVYASIIGVALGISLCFLFLASIMNPGPTEIALYLACATTFVIACVAACHPDETIALGKRLWMEKPNG